MKKKCILALILGAAFMAQGCGFTEGTDAVVTVVDSTPTPEPTEAPEETATPTPEATAEADSTAAADPTAQAAATEQTPSGINVQAQDALSGESLKCTGICDNGWIRVDYNGQTCYASGDYVSTTPPAGAAAATTDTAAAAQ